MCNTKLLIIRVGSPDFNLRTLTIKSEIKSQNSKKKRQDSYKKKYFSKFNVRVFILDFNSDVKVRILTKTSEFKTKVFLLDI